MLKTIHRNQIFLRVACALVILSSVGCVYRSGAPISNVGEWSRTLDEVDVQRYTDESLRKYATSSLEDSEIRKLVTLKGEVSRLLHNSKYLEWFEFGGAHPPVSDTASEIEGCTERSGVLSSYSLWSSDGREDATVALAQDSAIAMQRRPCIYSKQDSGISTIPNSCFSFAFGCHASTEDENSLIRTNRAMWYFRFGGDAAVARTIPRSVDRRSLAINGYELYFVDRNPSSLGVFKTDLITDSVPQLVVSGDVHRVLEATDDGVLWMDRQFGIHKTDEKNQQSQLVVQASVDAATSASWGHLAAVAAGAKIVLIDILNGRVVKEIETDTFHKSAGVSLDEEFLVWPEKDAGRICRLELVTLAMSCRIVGGDPTSVVRRGERLFWIDPRQQGIFEAKFVGFIKNLARQRAELESTQPDTMVAKPE